MTTWTIYGEGGYCKNCDPSHDHPLNNVIEERILEDFYGLPPYPSWTLNEGGAWVAPTEYPQDGLEYGWDEDSLSWVLVEV